MGNSQRTRASASMGCHWGWRSDGGRDVVLRGGTEQRGRRGARVALVRLRPTEEWIARFGESRNPVATAIGNFDGMHRGHQEILRRMIDRARRADLMVAVL